MSARPSWLFLAACMGVAGPRAAEEPGGAEVWVRAEHRGGGVVYRYEVRNREAARLDHFALGCDCRPPGDIVAGAQLRVLPTATTVREEDYRGHVLDVPRDRLTAPPGWQATVRTPRGAPRYWIEWRTFDPGSAISAGQALDGFAIALPAPDPVFLAAGYLVADTTTGQGRNGHVRPADINPPRLSVRLHARDTGDREGTVVVTTEIDVSDDIDPAPRVLLESFVREGPGEGGLEASRLALTYRAADASGNTTRETARIVLPAPLAGDGWLAGGRDSGLDYAPLTDPRPLRGSHEGRHTPGL